MRKLSIAVIAVHPSLQEIFMKWTKEEFLKKMEETACFSEIRIVSSDTPAKSNFFNNAFLFYAASEGSLEKYNLEYNPRFKNDFEERWGKERKAGKIKTLYEINGYEEIFSEDMA